MAPVLVEVDPRSDRLHGRRAHGGDELLEAPSHAPAPRRVLALVRQEEGVDPALVAETMLGVVLDGDGVPAELDRNRPRPFVEGVLDRFEQETPERPGGGEVPPPFVRDLEPAPRGHSLPVSWTRKARG